MKYLFLVRVDPDLAAAATPADNERMQAETFEWAKDLDSRGARLMGDRVQPAEKARIVRTRNRKPSVSDGPFSEAKEVIGGFDVIECRDMEEAVQIASRHPVTRIGAIEVRELWPM